jgi:hypothetical protein
MRTIEARPSCGSLTTARLDGPHRASVIAIALFVFSGTLQASGQGITVAPATISGGVRRVQDTCSAYQSVLKTSACASSEFVPLFNMQGVGNDWRHFLLGPNPPKFRETVQNNGKKTCIVVSNFAVDLSASVLFLQVDWMPVPTVGPVCTNESSRVNAAASSVSAQALQANADEILERFRLALRKKQRLIVPACGLNRNEAQTVLHREIGDC